MSNYLRQPILHRHNVGGCGFRSSVDVFNTIKVCKLAKSVSIKILLIRPFPQLFCVELSLLLLCQV